MKQLAVLVWSILLLSAPVLAAEGMINMQSAFSVAESRERLEKILQEKGMTIFKRIAHAKGAASVGIELRDSELIVFGNPKVGSPLMQCQPTVAIDLPQKALIWQDSQSRVWISYNDPGYLQARHAISGCEQVLLKIEKALAGIITAAASK